MIVAALAARCRGLRPPSRPPIPTARDPRSSTRLLCKAYGMRHEVLRLTVSDLGDQPAAGVFPPRWSPSPTSTPLSYQLRPGGPGGGVQGGADRRGQRRELFAGYPRHRFARRAGIAGDPGALFDAWLQAPRLPHRRQAYLRMEARARADERIALQRASFVEGFEAVEDSALNRFLRYDQTYQMQFSQLHRGPDVHGPRVEARTPFLYDLVLIAGLADDAKISLEGERAGHRAEDRPGRSRRPPAAARSRPRRSARRTVNLWDTSMMGELPGLFQDGVNAARFQEARAATSEWIDLEGRRGGRGRPELASSIWCCCCSARTCSCCKAGVEA